MYLIISTVFVGTGLIFLFNPFTKKADAAWFNEDWGYRQIVAITNAGSNLTNYPITITLDTATLISAGKMQSDCDDIRVTDLGGNILPHLLDVGASACNTSTTNISVKAPSITTSGATLYLYYGNPGAVDTQNGSQVFNEWDLTTFTKVDPNSRFTVDSPKQITVTSMSSNEDAYIYKTITSASTGTLDADVVRSAGAAKITCTGVSIAADDCLGAADGAYMIWPWGGNFQGYNTATDTHSSNITAMTSDGATTYYMRIKYDGANATFYVYSNPARTTLLGSQSLTFSTSFTQLFAVSSYNDGSAATISEIIRNVHTKAYTATEPVVASPASEEKAPQPVAYWRLDDGTGTNANDSTTNNYDATLTGSPAPTWQTENQCISGKCVYFGGSTSRATVASSISGVQSIAFWVRPISVATVGLIDFDGGTHKISVSSGVISATGFTSPTIYVNGVVSSTLMANQWQFVEVTTGTEFTGSAIKLAFDNTNYLTGFMDEPKIYNYARSAAQILADYNSRGNPLGASQVLGASNNQPNTLSSGLIGYWKADETSLTADCSTGSLVDSSGNGFNMKSCPSGGGGETTTTTGKFGGALIVDGSNDYYTNSVTGTSNKTIAMWVKRGGSGSSGYPRLIDSDVKIADYNNGGNLGVYTAGLNWQDTGQSLGSSTWNHVAVTADGSTLRVYWNGALIQTYTGATFSNNNGAVFGAVNGGTEVFNGNLDEMRVYNRILSNNEISQLYNFAPGPVGYWKFEEGSGTTVNDGSGNSNTGTFSGTGKGWGPGKYGSAGTFDGSDAIVDIGNSSTVGGVKNITVEAWFYKTAVQTNSSNIISKTSGSDSITYLINYDGTSSNIRFIAGTNTPGGYDVATTTAPSTNAWHHVAGVDNGTTIYIYIDGVLKSSTTKTVGLMVNGANNACIGGYSDAGNCNTTNKWSGKIDEVKIYNYARTQGQIIEDMNAGHPAPGSPVSTPILNWKFDSGYGTTANNDGSQGSTLNGTLTGMASPATGTSGWTQAGKFNKALLFNGSTDYVTLADPSNGSLDFGQNSFSLSAWVKTSSTGYKRVISKGHSGFTDGYLMQLYTGTGFISTGIGAGGTQANALFFYSDRAVNDGNWHHVATVFDWSSKQARIYIDGTPTVLTKFASTCGTLNGTYIDFSACSSLTASSTNAFAAGSYDTGGSEFWNGSIDEVKVYGQALTADQVKIDMNQGASQVLGAISPTTSVNTSQPQSAASEYCVPGDTVSSSCAAPVARWDFSEATGTVVNDSSGNANTGTWNGNGSHWGIGKAGNGKTGTFNGTDDYVSSSYNYPTTGLYTIEGWAKRTDSSAAYALVGSSNASNPVILRIETNSGIKFWRDGGGGTTPTWASAAPAAGTWFHWALVDNITGNSSTLYINGISQGAVSNSTAFVSPGTFKVGARGASTDPFKGQIDQIRVFNYARSQAQIAWDYNKGEPVGYWRLDDCQGTTATDQSGNSNTGTITIGGTGTYTTPGTCTASSASSAWYNGAVGKKNYSLAFDGTDDYVTIPDTSILDITNGITTSAWINPTSVAGLNQTILGKRDASAIEVNYALRTNATTVEFYWSNGGGYQVYQAAANLSANTWAYITATYDGSTVKIYKNGVLLSGSCVTGTCNNAMSADDNNLGIGNAGSLINNFFPGRIDDVKIFNYALTAAQVKSLYDGGSVNYGPVTGAP